MNSDALEKVTREVAQADLGLRSGSLCMITLPGFGSFPGVYLAMHGEHKSLLSILGSNKDAIVSNENILPFTEHGLVQSILQNRSRYGGMEIGQEIDLHKNLNQEDFYPRFR